MHNVFGTEIKSVRPHLNLAFFISNKFLQFYTINNSEVKQKDENKLINNLCVFENFNIN